MPYQECRHITTAGKEWVASFPKGAALCSFRTNPIAPPGSPSGSTGAIEIPMFLEERCAQFAG